jgi:hypothetical protein
MLAQGYGLQNGIKTSALFISIRRLGESAGSDVLYKTNIGLPYVFICMISASSGNKFSDYFFYIMRAYHCMVIIHAKAKIFFENHMACLRRICHFLFLLNSTGISATTI